MTGKGRAARQIAQLQTENNELKQMSDGATKMQTIEDIPKGASNRTQEGLLAERCVLHNPSSRLRYKSGKRVTKTPV